MIGLLKFVSFLFLTMLLVPALAILGGLALWAHLAEELFNG